MALLKWLFRRIGLARWSGYRQFVGYLQSALVKLARPTGHAGADMILWGVYGSVAGYLYEESGLSEPVGDLYSWAQGGFDDMVREWMRAVTGVKPESLTQYGLRKWAGMIAAKKVNEVSDLGIKTLYPVDQFLGDLSGVLGGAVLNGGMVGGKAIFDAAEAAAFKQDIAMAWNNSIINGRFRLSPVPETDFELIKRQRHATNQRNYAATHPRFALATNDWHPVRNAVIDQGERDEIAWHKLHPYIPPVTP